MKMPYCSTCTIGESGGSSNRITIRQRVARVVVGVGWLMLAWVWLHISIPAVAWTLAVVAVSFGISHVVAAWTAYPGCPELGAIASLVSRRYVGTRCGPWERVDKWLEPGS
jgi:hypothetical protein